MPQNPSLKAMLRHLLKPHAMTHINSHPDVFYEIVFSKVSQFHRKTAVPKSLFHVTLVETRLRN